MIALTPKEVAATAHTLQTAIVAEVTVTLELFALKQDLTLLIRCMHFAVMQSFRVIKSPNQESEVSNDTPHTSGAETPSQHFLTEIFQYVVGDTNKNNGPSTQFFVFFVFRSFFSEFNPTEVMLLKNFYFSKFDNTDSELRRLLRI